MTHVTTLNGELTIFRWNPNGSPRLEGPLHHARVEGSLGAFNSIVVDDLDPASPLPEVYIAGSRGIRRFDVVPQ